MRRSLLLVVASVLLLGAAMLWFDSLEPEFAQAPLDAPGMVTASSPRSTSARSAAADAYPEFPTWISGRNTVAAGADPPRFLSVRIVNESGGTGIPEVPVWLLDASTDALLRITLKEGALERALRAIRENP